MLPGPEGWNLKRRSDLVSFSKSMSVEELLNNRTPSLQLEKSTGRGSSSPSGGVLPW